MFSAKENKYIRLFKNTGWVFIGNISNKIVAFLMLPFYTHWMKPEEYGMSELLLAYSALLYGLFSCCIQDAIFIYPKGKPLNKQQRYFTTGVFWLFFQCIVATLLLKSFLKIVQIFSDVSFAQGYFWYIMLFVSLMMFQNYFQQFCRAINKMRVYAMSGVMMTIVTAVVAWLLVPRFRVIGFIHAQIAGYAVAVVYLFLDGHCARYFVFDFRMKLYLLQMLKYSIPLIPSILMIWVVNLLNRPLLEIYVGMAGIGLFSIAQKLPILISSLSLNLGNAWQITVVEEFRNDGYAFFYTKMMKFVFSICLLASIVVSLLLPVFYHYFINEKFYPSMPYVPFLLLWSIFSFMSVMVGANFSAVKQSKYFMYSGIASALSAILLYVLLIPFAGLAGAVVALIASSGVTLGLRIFYAWRLVHDRNLFAYIFFSCVYLFFCFITCSCSYAVIGTGAFFFGALLLWWNKDSFGSLRSRFRRLG